jgi:hypothetical protein
MNKQWQAQKAETEVVAGEWNAGRCLR